MKPIYLFFLLLLACAPSPSDWDVLTAGQNGMTMNYTRADRVVEFRENNTLIGTVELKSHSDVTRPISVFAGEDKVLTWYEFSNFTSARTNGLGNVTFLDLNGSVVRKNYSFVYRANTTENYSFQRCTGGNCRIVEEQHNKIGWVPFTSRDIPSGNLTIGVSASIADGEELDVVWNILGEELSRHAVVLGTSAGFVTTAPTGDPTGGFGTALQAAKIATRDTSDSTATTITEVGFWFDSSSTETGNFQVEMALYTDDGGDDPASKLESVFFDVNGSAQDAWYSASVSWSISGSTTYWIAAHGDETTSGSVRTDWENSGGGGYSIDTSAETPMSNPWSTSVFDDTNGMTALYAVWSAGAGNPCEIACPATTSTALDCSGKQVNVTGSGTWTVSASVTALCIDLTRGCGIDVVRGSGDLNLEIGQC